MAGKIPRLKMPRAKEYNVQQAVVDWMRLTRDLKDTIWHWNYLSGVKLPVHVASRAKKLGARRALPDLFLFEPRGNHVGLALELKRDDERIITLEGTYYDGIEGHLHEQAMMLEALGQRGWYATFGIGYDHATRIIHAYVRGLLDEIDSPFGTIEPFRATTHMTAMALTAHNVLGMNKDEVRRRLSIPPRIIF